MMATLPGRNRGPTVIEQGISAQELLTLKETTQRYGFLRERPRKKLSFGKWPQKFVVLTYDSVYVFASETSKSAESKFALVGYNRVERYESKETPWSFSIMPVPGFESVKRRTFACVTDQDRREWMKTVKTQLYEANHIPKPKSKSMDEIQPNPGSAKDIESCYLQLESPVFDPGTTTLEGFGGSAGDDDEASSGSVSSGSGGGTFVPKTGRSLSLPPQQNTYTDGESVPNLADHRSNSYDDATSAAHSPAVPSAPAPHLHNVPDNEEESSYDLPNEVSSNTGQHTHATQAKGRNIPLNRMKNDASFPPRYSAVVESEYVEEEEETTNEAQEDVGADYVNMASISLACRQESLESQCTVEDVSEDRDSLIRMLQATNNPGTYFIRKSRNSEQKVLAYLTKNLRVKEYKIFEIQNKYSIDKSDMFDTIEELLTVYTGMKPLPNSTDRLEKGFNSVRMNAK